MQTDFFAQIKAGALDAWRVYKVLPSMTGAQAALESNWGRSTLATEGKNLFGIKVSSDWTGEWIKLPTLEFINGKWITAMGNDDKGESFRKYPSWAASVTDHGIFFTENDFRKNNYKATIGETDYKKAVAGILQPIAQYSYATDPDYYTKVVSIIEQYELFNWDKEVLGSAVTSTPITGGNTTVGKIIFIDDGHGGTDNGAQSNGILEDAWNLEVCALIEKKLSALGHKVLSSRSTDVFIGLSERAIMANNAKADLFISCHVNAGGGKGYEDFIHDTLSGPADVAMQNAIHAAVVKVTSKYGMVDRGKKKANYAVLRETNMSAILLEAGFLDNSGDAAILKNPQFKEEYATAVVNGVQAHFGLSASVSAPVVTPAPVVNVTAKVDYKSCISVAGYSIDSKPWGQPGFEFWGMTDKFMGEVVGVIEEFGAYANTSLGWVDKRALGPVPTRVSADYNVVIKNIGYSIDTKPWGEPGFATKDKTDNFIGKTVHVTEENGGGQYINTELGWIDKRAVEKALTVVESILFLPNGENWVVYPENGPYSVGDVISVEGPKEDGGLSIKIEGDKGNNILVVDLPNEGRVGIYFNEGNGAKITRKYA